MGFSIATDNFAINRLLQERYGIDAFDEIGEKKSFNIGSGERQLQMEKKAGSGYLSVKIVDQEGQKVDSYFSEFKGMDHGPRGGSLDIKLPDGSVANFRTRVSAGADGQITDKSCDVSLMQVGREYVQGVEDDGLHIGTQETVRWSDNLRHANNRIDANGRVRRYRDRLRRTGEDWIETLKEQGGSADEELRAAIADVRREYQTGLRNIRDMDELERVWREAYRGAILKKKFPSELDPGSRPPDKVMDPKEYLAMLGQATKTLSEIKGVLENLQKED